MSRMLVLALAATLAASCLTTGCKSDDTPDPRTDGERSDQPGQPDRPPPPEPKLIGRDADDSTAPEIQGIFPRTAAPWLKVTGVRFYPADALDQVVGTGEVSYYRPYGVEWAADAQYQFEHQEWQRLVVRLFRCSDSADAYGLMSAASDMAYTVQIGQECRGGIGVHLHVWTGRYYLYLWSESQQGRTFLRAMEDMARQIVERLGGDGVKPALVRLLPTVNQVASQVHYFRGPGSLRSLGLSAVVHMRAFADALGLGPRDRLVLAAYHVPGLTGNCLIFIAQFADPARAREVHDNLVRIQNEANSPFAEGLMVGGQVDASIFGTLTAGRYSWLEKSAQGRDPGEFPVFPTIRKGLTELP